MTALVTDKYSIHGIDSTLETHSQKKVRIELLKDLKKGQVNSLTSVSSMFYLTINCFFSLSQVENPLRNPQPNRCGNKKSKVRNVFSIAYNI